LLHVNHHTSFMTGPFSIAMLNNQRVSVLPLE
jgi:hypothetical protein